MVPIRLVQFALLIPLSLATVLAADKTFPPRTNANDSKAQGLTASTQLLATVPHDDPLQPRGNVAELANSRKDVVFLGVLPRPGEFTIAGGALVTAAGKHKMLAKFSDWDYLWQGSKPIGWVASLTSGEVLVPRWLLLDAPAGIRVPTNSFSIEDFGSHFFLIRLDPTKKHRLGILKDASGIWRISAGVVGTRAEFDGLVFERKPDGWYQGPDKVYPGK